MELRASTPKTRAPANRPSWRWGITRPAGERRPDVALIVPTYREEANVERLVKRVFAATAGQPWSLEMLIVDDRSPDGTGDRARQIAERDELPLRVLERDGPRGLAVSVLDGFFATTAPVLAVMDADLSHPPEALSSLVDPILAGIAELTIGSRYVEGGATPGWRNHRKIESAIGTALCRPLCRSVRDPLSGFFAIRRTALPPRSQLSPRGYKIGLELLVKAEGVKDKKAKVLLCIHRIYNEGI